MSCNHCNNHNHEHNHSHNNEKETIKLMVFRLILGIVLFLTAFYTKKDTIYLISYVVLGYDVVWSEIKSIKNIFNEHFLMSVATIGAIAIGNFPEAVIVMLFYQIGELLSDFAVDKSKKRIGDLIDLRSDTATVLVDGAFATVPSQNVKEDDIIRVSAGEKIPLDGEVIEGTAYLDTKSLTGESKPQKVTVGDNVLSGSICNDSILKIKVTKSYENSTANKILELIDDDKQSNSEKFITKFAKIYTPIVVFLALLIVLIPTVLGYSFREWFYRSMLFLVVSCPCALVVSVPLSFFSGLGCASKNGILIKGAFALEEASKLKTIAFDKTGTLTEGDFTVQQVRSERFDKYSLLKYAAYAEYHSSHPIGKAVVLAFSENIDENKISEYKEISGKGILAIVDGHKVLVGSENFIGCQSKENAVFVSIDDEYAGYIEIYDKTKDNALSAIIELNKLGVSSIMLTGDTKENANKVAKSLNLPYFAGLLPQDKVFKLEELKSKNHTGFVGDGINDAPVLSHSNVGISMGEAGSDAAIEASDVVIISDNLEKIPMLIKISRKTMQIVKENICLSISVKVLVMLLGAFGFASMWFAVFADVGVCLLAVFNSLRAFIIKD